jgi:hypothetical protein
MRLGQIEKTAIKWGILTFLGLGAYFLAMKLLGFIHILELRVLNAGIMFGGCYMAIREIRNNLDEFNYFKGLGTGLLTAFTAASLFTLFGILYLEVINPEFMVELKEKEPLGHLLNPYLASFQIFIEGSASGFSISYAIMQYMKKPILEKA